MKLKSLTSLKEVLVPAGMIIEPVYNLKLPK